MARFDLAARFWTASSGGFAQARSGPTFRYTPSSLDRQARLQLLCFSPTRLNPHLVAEL